MHPLQHTVESEVTEDQGEIKVREEREEERWMA